MTGNTVAELIHDWPDLSRPWRDGTYLRGRAQAAVTSPLTREAWKYSQLPRFVSALAALPTLAEPRIEGLDQPGVRLRALDELDDATARELSAHLNATDNQRHVLADLSLLRASGGWLLDIDASLPSPLLVRYPDAGITPLFVRLAANVSAELHERCDGAASLAQITQVALARGAQLAHHRSALDGSAQHWALLDVTLADSSRYCLELAQCGGVQRRSEIQVRLSGRGAEAELRGAYLIEAGTHLDQQLTVEHLGSDGTSRQTFHGIGAGRGRSIFNGRIHIHPHAPRTNAELSNRNLALDSAAEMNTKPELEIYTDDVRCAHGATVGQLAQDSLFYLASRGIDLAAARTLLCRGFLAECLQGPLAQESLQRFMGALPQ
ncbi:MAG: SufD family Fe-S cluster assembly protein [Pseudomonadales bacterium]